MPITKWDYAVKWKRVVKGARVSEIIFEQKKHLAPQGRNPVVVRVFAFSAFKAGVASFSSGLGHCSPHS